jgi:hypothetical protein
MELVIKKSVDICSVISKELKETIYTYYNTNCVTMETYLIEDGNCKLKTE